MLRSPRTPSHRPHLELLEDRTAPASLVLNPGTLAVDTVNVAYQQTITPENVFYASQVVPGGYTPGTLLDANYDDPSTALGGLNAVAGLYQGYTDYLTPFDPEYDDSGLVEIGAGGSLELQLAQTASTNGYTIGVHTGFGLLDANYPSGTNSNPASYTNYWIRQADVQVSSDGVNWGDLGTITFDNPSNVHTGVATSPDGLTPGVGPLTDVGQPFLGTLASFNGENWQQALATLNGSAGGTWLNLSGVTDQNGNPITGVNYIKFTVPNNPPIDPNTGYPELMLVDAVVGTSAPAGGTGAVTLTVSNVHNAIPGLHVPAHATGSLTITGTPVASGTETFTVTARDGAGDVAQTQYAVTVTPNLTLTPAKLPVATVGDSFTAQLRAHGGTGTGYTFSSTDLPAGLSLSASGKLSGMPTNAADSPDQFTVTVTDGRNQSRTFSETLIVDPAITVTPNILPGATVGQLYHVTLIASGGSDTGFHFTAHDLPKGLTLSRAGVLSGRPKTETGSPFTFTVTVADSKGGSVTEPYALTVA